MTSSNIIIDNENLLRQWVDAFLKFTDQEIGFKVICDETNNSEEDQKNHKLNVDIEIYNLPYIVIEIPQGCELNESIA